MTEWGNPTYPDWLWQSAVDLGLIAGDPNYYKNGEATGHEYINAVMHSLVALAADVEVPAPPPEPEPPTSPTNPVSLWVPGIDGAPIWGIQNDANLEEYTGPTTLKNVPRLEGYVFRSPITVAAGHTVFENCAFRTESWINLRTTDGGSAEVWYCDIGNDGKSQFGVTGRVSVFRSYLHDMEDCIKLGSGQTYEQNYLGPLQYTGPFTDDPHEDCMQASGGFDNIVIKRNNMKAMTPEGSYQTTSCIIMKTDSGPQNGAVIEGNHMEGGSYTIYSRDGGHGYPTNIYVRDNVFYGGVWGIKSGRFDIWEGNTDPDGNPV